MTPFEQLKSALDVDMQAIDADELSFRLAKTVTAEFRAAYPDMKRLDAFQLQTSYMKMVLLLLTKLHMAVKDSQPERNSAMLSELSGQFTAVLLTIHNEVNK